MQLPPLPFHLIPQHRILKHPQPAFPSQWFRSLALKFEDSIQSTVKETNLKLSQ
jgi:hypothetical protein